MIIAIYINKLFLYDIIKTEISRTKIMLNAKFDISDLKSVFFYLEMTVTQYCANEIFF